MTQELVYAAIGIPLALVVLFLLWFAISRRRAGYTIAQAIWYLINSLVNRILWRTKVSGPLPVAAGQGAVIVCNHTSGIDPLLIQMATKRVVHWMVAKEYFSYSMMAACFRSLGSIPVSRGGVDTAATKQAIRLAKEGKLVGLFPEGRINTSKDLLLPGRLGAAMIALKAGVPVIPCYIKGAPYNGSALGPFLMRARAQVTFGKPILLDAYADRETDRQGDREVLAELTKRFLKEIAALSGDPSFEPRLAGKRWNLDDADDESEDDGPAPSKAGDAAQPTTDPER